LFRDALMGTTAQGELWMDTFGADIRARGHGGRDGGGRRAHLFCRSDYTCGC
jgi:hypothetical protein